MKFILDFLKQLLFSNKVKSAIIEQVVESPTFQYFTMKEYLNGHSTEGDLSEELKNNSYQLLSAVDEFRAEYGKPLIVTSGYRPPTYNASIGGAANSAHMTCEAIDLKDADGEVKRFIKQNIGLLKKLNLYMESGRHTPTWLHLQTRPPKSGRRVFKP